MSVRDRLIAAVTMFSGCSNIIKTDIGNAEFVRSNKNIVCGKYIDGNPAKIKFKNHDYVMTSKKVPDDNLYKRAGLITKDEAKRIYLWVYTIKGEKESDKVAVFIDKIFYEADISK
mgnify:FL=1